MRLRRGEVWWVQLDPARGAEIKKTRPCVIVSSNDANDRRLTVMVVPFSTSPNQHPPFSVNVHCAGKKVSAIVDQTRAVTKERFLNREEIMLPEAVAAIERALAILLEI